jgi:hypothetical protein
MHTIARRDIGLELTREQCGLIVEGLAERPFGQVFELIGQLHTGASTDGASRRFTLNPAQLRLILDTLGGMPFARVSRLLQSMHQQMRADKH